MKIVRINTNTLTAHDEGLPDDLTIVGARALTARILNAEVAPKADPLGRESKLVIAIGPLAGTMAPSLGRLSVGAKSPLTHGIKEANAGGTAGQKLDKLGIRAIVVEGTPADDKLYVVTISKEGVSFQDADAYRGMGNYELVTELRKQCNDTASIISVGPIGERKHKSATIAFTDKDGHPSRHAARGGLGAVMAAKGLKAIIVDDAATPDVQIGDKTAFRNAIKEWANILKEERMFKIAHEYGTPGFIATLNKLGSMPSKNYTGEPTEGIENIYGKTLKEKNTERGGRMDGCMPGCLIRCSIIFNDSDGRHVTSALEYETFGLMGTNLGITDLDAIAGLERRCDNMGIDTIELGSALGVAASAGKFEMGDAEAVANLLSEIEQGTEFGATLADGVVSTAKALGVTRIPAFKGQGIPAHDPRVSKSAGVTYATSPMGADHTAGMTYELEDEGAVELSLREQITMATVDAMGLCYFSITVDRKVMMEFLKDLLNARYGLNLTADDVVDVGRGTLRDEMKFNAEAGFVDANDPDPEFIRVEPLPASGMVFGVSADEMARIWDNLDTASIF